LGNYLGALSNWVDLQNEAKTTNDELIFFIVGLHAITLPQNPKQLLLERRDMLATLLAIGLNPHRCTIFHQDQVQEHTELAWYLNCLTPMGKLNRMTTWKVSHYSTSIGVLLYSKLFSVQAGDCTQCPIGRGR
jgi:tryptophanyl-tRNA synthetase